MTETNILFADSINFHKKNFKSLFLFIKKNKIKNYFDENHRTLKCSFGNYKEIPRKAENQYNEIANLSKNQLFQLKINNLNIYNFYESEILSAVMTMAEWHDAPVPDSCHEIFNKLYNLNKEALLKNIAITLFWIKYWEQYLSDHPETTHCCVFSGSLIYAKTLIVLAKQKNITPLVFEHFFTGNHYYCENRTSGIANNSLIKSNSYYEQLPNPKSLDTKDYQISKKDMYTIIKKMRNRNVVQPKKDKADSIKTEEKSTVVILGQVLNDFALLEGGSPKSSIIFYKELITKLLSESEYNIIFKSHPFEKKKQNLKDQ